MKELFQSAGKLRMSWIHPSEVLMTCWMLADETAELESYKTQKTDMFSNVGPGYYGDLDEADGSLLAYEQAAEAEGVYSFRCRSLGYH